MGKSVEVQGTEVSILTRDNKDYISLTDMVKAKDGNFFISDWLRNRNTVEFLGIWEQIHNPCFNYGEFVQMIRRTSNGDVYLQGALYLLETDMPRRHALLDELAATEYAKTEDALFVLSLFDDQAHIDIVRVKIIMQGFVQTKHLDCLLLGCIIQKASLRPYA